MTTFSKLIVPFLLAALVLTACGDDDKGGGSSTAPDYEATVAASISAVTRQQVAMTSPSTSPGQVLELTRVIIPAGQEIAPHTHPGPQMAVISAGVLTYSVLSQQVEVTRGAGTSSAKSETVVAGKTTELRAGDTVIELPGMTHTARNNGDVAVVIYLSSLFPQGAPASSPAP